MNHKRGSDQSKSQPCIQGFLGGLFVSFYCLCFVKLALKSKTWQWKMCIDYWILILKTPQMGNLNQDHTSFISLKARCWSPLPNASAAYQEAVKRQKIVFRIQKPLPLLLCTCALTCMRVSFCVHMDLHEHVQLYMCACTRACSTCVRACLLEIWQRREGSRNKGKQEERRAKPTAASQKVQIHDREFTLK